MNALIKANLAQVSQPSGSESKEFLRKARAFDQAMIGMALLDLQGRWIDVNPRFCRMLGYQRSSLLARSYVTLTHEEDLEVSRRYLARLLSGEIESCEIEKRYYHASGRIIWAQIHAALVRPDNEDAPFIISQALDITEQRATREALEESESLLSLAVAGADLGMWHWQVASGDFIFNDRALHLLGYREGEVSSRLSSIIDLVHPDDREGLVVTIVPHLKGKRSGVDQVLRFRKRDGSYMWLLVRGRVTRRDANGWAIQVSGTIMDVSKWKELERRLTRMATTDELTGLLNRRSGVAALKLAMKSSDQMGRPMSMALLDVDRFKAINDKLGHQTGDKVLESLGAFVKTNLRSGDYAVRWGGEEFAIILPDTGSEGASAQAQRLFDAIGQVSDHIAGLDQLTVSMGVATRREGESAANLMKRADALMYQAKDAGRNNIKTD